MLCFFLSIVLGGNKGGFLAIRCRWSRFLKWFHYVSLLLPWTSIVSLDIERCTDCCVYIYICTYDISSGRWSKSLDCVTVSWVNSDCGKKKTLSLGGPRDGMTFAGNWRLDEIFQFTLGDDHPPQGFPHLPWRFWGKALWSTSTSHAGWWLAFPMIHGNGIFTYIDPIKNQPFM